MITLILLFSLLMIGSVSATSDTNATLSSDAIDNHITATNIDKTSSNTNTDKNSINTKKIDDENNDNNKINENTQKIETKNNKDKLSSTPTRNLLTDTPGNFSDLQNAINDISKEGTINLNNNYTYDTGVNKSGILIEDKKITINGNGHTLDAKRQGRIFQLKNATLILDNLQLINGKTKGDDIDQYIGFGGAIRIDKKSTLNITNAQFNSNQAEYNGGAIISSGTLTVINTTFNQNQAGFYSGAIYIENSNAKIMNSLFNKNTDSDSKGDGIYNYNGTCVVEECVFIDDHINTNIGSTTTQGTKFIDDENSFTALDAIINYGDLQDSITLEHDYTYDSTSDGETYKKGIIINRTVTINGNGHTINGNKTARIFKITNNAKVTITNITLTQGKGQNEYLEAYYNYYNVGGAIYADQYTHVNINNTTFTNNTAEYAGGAIEFGFYCNVTINNTQFTENNASYGGAIRAESSTNVTINNTTFTNNTAERYGGAICTYNNNLTITNSIIQDNNASKSSGIYIENGTITTISTKLINNTIDGENYHIKHKDSKLNMETIADS